MRFGVVGLVGLSAVLSLVLWRWQPALWIPSLACNLLTTGIAIWLVNWLVGDLERRESERTRRLREAVEQSVKRQAERQAASGGPIWIMGALQIMEGLAVSSEKGEVARRGWRVQHGDVGENLRDTLMIYGQWLDYELLFELDELQNSLRRLARDPQGVQVDLDEFETWFYADHIVQVAEQVSSRLGLKLGDLIELAKASREQATRRMAAENPMAARVAQLRQG
jgi:hypothetical protein